MRTLTRHPRCAALTIALSAVASSAALAQTSFDIPWWSADCGGGTTSGLHAGSGTTFTISATIGQHEAGPAIGAMTGSVGGSTFTLLGGYLAGFAPALPRCVADTDDGSGTGTPDGGVTIDDLLFYLFIFEAGDIRSDVDDGSSTGTPDGGVTIDDLLYYLQRFEAGC